MNQQWYRPNFKCFKLYLNTIFGENINFYLILSFLGKNGNFYPRFEHFPLFWSIFDIFFSYFYPIFGTWNGLYKSRTIIWKNWYSLIHIWSTTSKLEPVKVMKMLKFWLYFEKKSFYPIKNEKISKLIIFL